MISTGQIIVILVVVLLLFGTKRLRNIGSDVGAAIKGFKKSMSEGEQDAQQKPPADQQPGRVIDNNEVARSEQKQDSNKKS